MKKIKYSAYFLSFVCFIIFTGLAVSCKDGGGSPVDIKLLSFGPCPIPRLANLRIIGTNLDQVQSVALPGCDAIAAGSFTKKTSTEINLTVPETAESGKITLNAGSQAISSITDLTIFGKIELTGFSPTTAKAGDIVKLEGKDLDFVQEVIFPDDIHILKADFVSQSLTAIEVKVPEEAKAGLLAVSDGAETPIMAYFKDDFTAVLPAITSFSPETVKAGSVLTITGTDFDLVKSITFGGLKDAESFVVSDDKTSITVTVPVDALDGAFVLTALSGATVTSETDLIMAVPTITSIDPNPISGGDILTVKGTDLDLVSQVMFGKIAGTIMAQSVTEIQVEVPALAKTGVLTFNTLAGKSVQSEELTVLGATSETPIWSGTWTLEWGNPLEIDKNDLKDVPVGSILKVYYTITSGAGADLAFNTANWGSKIPTGNEWSKADNTLGLPAGSSSVEIVLTDEFRQAMEDGMNTWNNTWVMLLGQGADITTVSIVESVVSTETVIWTGNFPVGDWANWLTLSADDFAPAKVGQTLAISIGDIDPSGGYSMLEFQNASWSGFADISASGTDDQVLELVISDQALLDNLQGGDVHIGGAFCSIKQISLK